MDFPAVHEIFGTQGAFNLLLFGRILIAVALGFLIGMEREIARVESGQQKIAGLRTIVFLTMLGSLSQLIDENGTIFIVSFVLAALFLLGAAISNAYRDRHYGLTTPMVSLMAFLLGGMVIEGDRAILVGSETLHIDLTLIAVITAILVTLLLSLKLTFERVIKSVTPEEFFATLKFGIIAFIILPFLPRQPLSDFIVFPMMSSFESCFDSSNAFILAVLSAINPYKLWLMVVLISGIGFIGYVLTKLVGQSRGVGISGFLGGLVSSTAVMGAMASRSKSAEPSVRPFVVATTIASITSFVRVLIEVLVTNRSIALPVAGSMLVMVAVAIIALRFMPKRATDTKQQVDDVEHQSPFTLGPALTFTGFILIIKILVKLAATSNIHGALYALAVVSGLADVDALTLSVSTEALDGRITPGQAGVAIVLAVLANMASKAVIARFFGSKTFSRRIAIVFGVIIAAGLCTLPFVLRLR